MRFTIRPFRRFPVQCPVTYNAGPFHGQGTCGTSRAPVGMSPETYRCVLGKSSR